jgi:hypothetical protein
MTTFYELLLLRYDAKPIIHHQHQLLIILHCTENPIYVFPEMILRGLVPDSYIHSQDRSAYLAAAK